MDKKWYKSKTIWTNLVMGVAVIVQIVTGQELFDAEAQAAAIVLINMILRAITKENLTW